MKSCLVDVHTSHPPPNHRSPMVTRKLLRLYHSHTRIHVTVRNHSDQISAILMPELCQKVLRQNASVRTL